MSMEEVFRKGYMPMGRGKGVGGGLCHTGKKVVSVKMGERGNTSTWELFAVIEFDRI